SMVEVRGDAENMTTLRQGSKYFSGLRFAAPSIGASEMSVQFLKACLGIRHIVENFTDDGSPARNFARLIGAEVAGIVRFFLTAERCTKTKANGCLVETSAETTPYSLIDRRRGRFRMDERPDRIEKHNGRKWS